jgi:hypothetical protein
MIRAMRRVAAKLTATDSRCRRAETCCSMLALHHQIAILARSHRRFRPSDRLLWLVLRPLLR